VATDRPLRKDSVLPREVDGESILYDTDSGSVHVVNAAARRVWDLCDGAHTVAEMAAAIRDAFDVPAGASVDEDVRRIVAQFTEMGILTGETA